MSQDSDPKKSILRKVGELRLNASAGHTVKFSGCTWHQIRIRERRGPSRGIVQKCEPHERIPCTPKFEERTLEETSRQEDCARKAAWDLPKSVYELKKVETKLRFYSPVDTDAPILISKTPARMFVFFDSGASMHMLSKKDLSSDELDTLRRSGNPTTLVTAHGEVQTNEEA